MAKTKTKKVQVVKLGQGTTTVELGEDEGLKDLLKKEDLGISRDSQVRVNNTPANDVGDELKEGDVVTTVPNVRGG